MQFRLRQETEELIDDLTLVEQFDIGNARNAVFGGQPGMLFGVDLDQFPTTFRSSRSILQDRSEPPGV